MTEQAGLLDPETAILVSMAGLATLIGAGLHGRWTERMLRKVKEALSVVVAEITRVDDEIEARLLKHRPEPK